MRPIGTVADSTGCRLHSGSLFARHIIYSRLFCPPIKAKMSRGRGNPLLPFLSSPFHFGIDPNGRLLGIDEDLQRMLNDGLPDHDNPLDMMRHVFVGGVGLNGNENRRRRPNDNERNMLPFHRFAAVDHLFNEAVGPLPAMRNRRIVPNLPEASSSSDSSEDELFPPHDDLPSVNDMIEGALAGALPPAVRIGLAVPPQKKKQKKTNKETNDANNASTAKKEEKAEENVEKMDTSSDTEEPPDVMDFWSTRCGWYTQPGEKYRKFK